jgi:deferrochelatase/peroxidase EfeB
MTSGSQPIEESESVWSHGSRNGGQLRRRSVLTGMSLPLIGATAVACTSDAADDDGARTRTKSSSPAVAVPASLRGVEPPVHTELVALDAVEGVRYEELINLLGWVKEAAPEHGGIAVGRSAFTGLEDACPEQLRPMPSFAGDLLDPARSHGDVLVQIGGRDELIVREAVRLVLGGAGTQWRVRWRLNGVREGSRTDKGRGLNKNPFHFTEGFGNPEGQGGIADRALVRAGGKEPKWAVGGTYQVVRIIQMATALWDADSKDEQEKIIGRRRDGRWLDGTPSGERPDFASDPRGRATPLDSHVRLAAPDRRNPPPMVRRSYAYHRDDVDQGLIFSCFQRDLGAGFEAVQRRLRHEAMAKYVLTVGGGYFFVPPPNDSWTEIFQRKEL